MKIFARQRPDTDVRELKAISLLDATAYKIGGAIRDYGNYTKTMPYTVEAKVLSRERGGKLIYFYSRLDMPLVSSRDYIIKIVDESAWKDGMGFLKASWTAVNDKDSLVPLKEFVYALTRATGSSSHGKKGEEHWRPTTCIRPREALSPAGLSTKPTVLRCRRCSWP